MLFIRSVDQYGGALAGGLVVEHGRLAMRVTPFQVIKMEKGVAMKAWKQWIGAAETGGTLL
ncbi:hypothetical protein [Massilia aquatica]|uniref:Uncharacterized protein n=1 Tax=Massilia aquatica TaxID=2609000 RepID=A0ABX0LXF4_9BURK|nr:hypothetical protein [Massilia aquatica]NHZ39500.1 hypothetical protein [Massilia aquatica]